MSKVPTPKDLREEKVLPWSERNAERPLAYRPPSKAKRLSGPELAAEVRNLEAEHWQSMYERRFRSDDYQRLKWIRKFASLPHYDEEPA